MSLADKIEQYNEQERNYSFEGHHGLRKFEELVKVLGYNENFSDPITDFLVDNPGAIEAMVEWIGTQRNNEWSDKLDEVLIPDDEE